ncbi:MAG TPA: hypothetical protein OIL93_02380 [Oscillospiraceae bacterium]|nr:hypothetical protein [Oscillospiraceae bacterium]
MKTKLRRFTAVLSAMLCMICCVLSAVPAFATDIGTSYTTWNDTIKQNVFSCIPDSDKTDYYTVFAAPNGSGFTYTIIFCKSGSSVTYFGSNLHCYVSKSDYNAFACVLVTSENKPIYDDTATLWWSENGDYYDHDPYDYSGGHYKVIYSNVPVLNWEDKKTPVWDDPNAPVVPFSVQYSRKLTTGMSRSGTLSAPGAKNDGETITNNNIDVTVKLTDEYKQAMQKALDKDPKATQYTYQYVLFITPYDPNIFGTKKAMDGAIYTFLDKSKYVLTTAYGKTKSNTTTDSKYDTVSTPDSSSTDTSSSNVGEMTSDNADGVANSAFCNGVTPLFGLPIANGANMTNTHTINLENIKGADKLREQDILYIVVVGKRYLYETGAEGYAKDFYANNAEFKTFYKELPDNAVASKINGLYGGNGYDFYTVVSDGFSFKDYPDYKPLEINGVEYPTDKPISDMLDDPFPPSKITDYDGLENGTDFDTKEDFDDYINNKKYDEQYGTFNFNLTDISSIFDGSSDFFKFMTASIGILPPIFITILIAFFTIMLAICLVKWVVK